MTDTIGRIANLIAYFKMAISRNTEEEGASVLIYQDDVSALEDMLLSLRADKSKLFALIDRTALESMLTPCFYGNKVGGTMLTTEELSNRNAMISMNNEGIRDYVIQLKAATEEAENE